MKTLDQVRSALSDIEPSEQTYSALVAEDIPHLEALAGDGEEWISARAVHALARFDVPKAHEAIVRSSTDARPTVRIAASRVLPRLPAAVSERLLEHALDDADIGVRKFALSAVPATIPAGIRAKIARIATSDSSEALRAMASELQARTPVLPPRKPIILKPRKPPR